MWIIVDSVLNWSVRVGDQTLLIEAVKHLSSQVCSAADKTIVNDAVEYFTSRMNRQTLDKKVEITSPAVNSAALDSAERSVTSGSCPGDQNVSVSSCCAEQTDVKDAKVMAADADRSADKAVSRECDWKLLLKVPGRRKNMPQHR